MSAYPLVFVHGWGCAPSFWDGLASQFPDTAQHRVDFGFTGDAGVDQVCCPDGIYITHSLGTMWALQHALDQIKALVAINGFTTFRPFAPKRLLTAMQARLRDDPAAQMDDFWAACGLMQRPDIGALNVERLEDGLDWLATWDETGTLKNLDVPVLSLIAEDDRILALEGMQKMWQGSHVRVKEGGGHALPQAETAWCGKAIKDFLDDKKLEIKCSAEL